jgi:hypothetical protein
LIHGDLAGGGASLVSTGMWSDRPPRFLVFHWRMLTSSFVVSASQVVVVGGSAPRSITQV